MSGIGVTDRGLIEWLHELIKPLVASPDELEVRQVGAAGSTVLLAITAAEQDIGRIVGAHGRVISALRVLASAHGSRLRFRVALDVPQSPSSRLGS
jgi:predicted RNA-binding protein YlqC (UPF0109 family)